MCELRKECGDAIDDLLNANTSLTATANTLIEVKMYLIHRDPSAIAAAFLIRPCFRCFRLFRWPSAARLSDQGRVSMNCDASCSPHFRTSARTIDLFLLFCAKGQNTNMSLRCNLQSKTNHIVFWRRQNNAVAWCLERLFCPLLHERRHHERGALKILCVVCLSFVCEFVCVCVCLVFLW